MVSVCSYSSLLALPRPIRVNSLTTGFVAAGAFPAPTTVATIPTARRGGGVAAVRGEGRLEEVERERGHLGLDLDEWLFVIFRLCCPSFPPRARWCSFVAYLSDHNLPDCDSLGISVLAVLLAAEMTDFRPYNLVISWSADLHVVR